jgi:tRNA (guanine-N7-)-methyltransferase
MDTVLPRLALDLSAPPGDLRLLYPNPVEEVRLEIGFGGGEYMISQACAQPHVGFVGVEPFVNGMAKALAALAAHSLSNVRLHHGDATDVLDWLSPNSLARVEMLYPDPWPKRRHWKRRFVQDDSVMAIGRVLRPGAEFRFATDVADYAAWTLEHFLRCPQLEWTAERADDWRRPWPDFSGTRYESKAVGQGRPPCYLTFRKRPE